MNRLLCLLLAAALLCAAPPALAAKAPVTAVPSEIAGFVRIDYARDNFAGKLCDLADKLMDEPLRQTVRQMQDAFGFSPLEREFLTNFASLTLVVFEPTPDPKKPDGPPVEKVGVIVELKDVETFQKYLEKIRAGAKSGSKTFKVSLYDKAKFPIEVFEMAAQGEPGGEPETLYTAFFDNLFAIGVGKETGVAVLETLQGTAAGNIQSVERSAGYARLAKAFPAEATAWGYVNGEFIARDTKREFPAAPVDYVDAAGFSLNYAKGHVTADGLVLFKKDAKSPVLDYLKQEPVALGSPALLPAATIFYHAFRFAFTKPMLEEPRMKDLFAQLNGMLGIDVEKDILPWLGNEYHLALSDYAMVPAPPFPAPRITLGVRVNDEKACRDAMEKIEAAYKLRTGISFEGTTEGTLAYRSIVVPTGGMIEDFSLAYLVHDGHLVIGSGRGAIGELSKVKAKEIPSLKDDPLFRDLLGPFAEKTIFSGFVNGERLATFMIRFMEMQNTPEAEMRDVRLTRMLRGLGFGFSHDGEGARLRADLAIDKDLLFKTAAEPDEDKD